MTRSTGVHIEMNLTKPQQQDAALEARRQHSSAGKSV
jgi:hypothetical protein